MFGSSRGLLAASLLFSLFAGGCSTGGIFGSREASPASVPATSADGVTDRIARFFSGASAKGPQTATNAQPDVNCPPIEIRQGASTLSINPTGEKSPMAVKYQGEFTREARECTLVGGNLVMRIGVEGRVIVGPAGGPGQVQVPLRIAIVQETPGGTRPIVTKFIRIPVAITSEQNAVFTNIEDGISFPLPTPISQLDDYIAYVGFDPLAAEAQDKQRSAAKPKLKAHAKPAVSAK